MKCSYITPIHKTVDVILELHTCTRIHAHVSGTLEMREMCPYITEADHLQEWFSSAATRGERVISLATYGSLLMQLQHYSLASIDKCHM